jgi:hypothetical protein
VIFELFALLVLFDGLFEFVHSSSNRVMRWISLGKSTWGVSLGFAVEGSCLGVEGSWLGVVTAVLFCGCVEGVRGEQPTARLRMAVQMIIDRHRSGLGGREGMGMRMVYERVVRLQDRRLQRAR